MEIAVAADELNELRRAQIRPRSDWPAVFSCNRHKHVWRWNTYGYTRCNTRAQIEIPLLDRIVRAYLRVRRKGGRFFIDRNGAYYRQQDYPKVKFISFRRGIWRHPSIAPR